MICQWVEAQWKQLGTDSIIKGFRENGYIGYTDDTKVLHSRLQETLTNRRVPENIIQEFAEIDGIDARSFDVDTDDEDASDMDGSDLDEDDGTDLDRDDESELDVENGTDLVDEDESELDVENGINAKVIVESGSENESDGDDLIKNECYSLKTKRASHLNVKKMAKRRYYGCRTDTSFKKIRQRSSIRSLLQKTGKLSTGTGGISAINA